MTWVAWRQGRAENVLAVALLAALAALLVLTGAHMRSIFSANGLAACTGASARPASCALLSSQFESQFDTLNQLGSWLGLMPGLIGVLLAAPLVLELEHGTFRLAWTQSVTPQRWFATRVAALLFGAILCGGLMIALAGWGRSPLDALLGRINPNSFDVEGVVPIAYALFAATTALAIGTVTRRTGLAVSAGFGAYIVVRLILRNVRQNLIPPVRALMPIPQGPRHLPRLGDQPQLHQPARSPRTQHHHHQLLQRTRQPRRPLPCPPPRLPRLRLGASKPLLGAAGDRGRGLPRPVSGRTRPHRVVDQTAHRLTPPHHTSPTSSCDPLATPAAQRSARSSPRPNAQ